MLPKWHILFGAIFSLIVYYFSQVSAFYILVLFLSSFLFDVDHYLFNLFRYGDVSLKKSYLRHKKLPRNHKPMTHIFHTIEFILLIGIMGYFSKLFLFVFIGIIFHSIIDLIDFAYYKKWGVREFFLTRYLFSKDKSKYF